MDRKPQQKKLKKRFVRVKPIKSTNVRPLHPILIRSDLKPLEPTALEEMVSRYGYKPIATSKLLTLLEQNKDKIKVLQAPSKNYMMFKKEGGLVWFLGSLRYTHVKPFGENNGQTNN